MTIPASARTRRCISRSATALLVLILAASGLIVSGKVIAGSEARVRLSVERVAPRQVEDQTEKAIIRDYSAAWASLGKALEQNRPDQLGDLWTGFARQNLITAIQQQKQSGLRIRYVDNAHNLNAVFYSPEGSALELRDTAQLRRQLLDGDNVVSSEDLTVHYLVVMTPTSDHWQVRILQSVPGF
jgi:hypothetical protein